MSVMNFVFSSSLGTGDVAHRARLPVGDRVQVLIFTSLFTDARVSEGELPEGETDRRGAWSDRFHNRQRGSKLWTLRRAKLGNNTLQLARAYALEALQWLVENGEVLALDVQVAKLGPHRGKLVVFYTDVNGGKKRFEQPLTTGEGNGVES